MCRPLVEVRDARPHGVRLGLRVLVDAQRGVKVDVLDRWGTAPIGDAQREGFPHVEKFLEQAQKAADLGKGQTDI